MSPAKWFRLLRTTTFKLAAGLLLVFSLTAICGLGYVLWDAYYVGRMDIVIADMVSIGLMGYLSDRIIVLVEQRVLNWRRLQSH